MRCLATHAALVVACLTTCGGGSMAASRQDLARVTAVLRDVKTLSAGSSVWRTPPPLLGLSKGDHLRTGRRSMATLRLSNGGTVTVDERSEVIVIDGRHVGVVRGSVRSNARGRGTLIIRPNG